MICTPCRVSNHDKCAQPTGCFCQHKDNVQVIVVPRKKKEDSGGK